MDSGRTDGGPPDSVPKVSLLKGASRHRPPASAPDSAVPPVVAVPLPPPAAPVSERDPDVSQQPSPRSARSRTVLVLVAALTVVVLAGGGYLLGGGGSTTSPADAETAAGGSPDQGAGGGGSSASGGGTAGDADASERGADVASSIYGLIQDSSRDKASIQTAAGELTSCGDLAGAATTFDAAEDSRNDLANQAGDLDTFDLPEAVPLIDELIQAWNYSAQADAAFADAARYAPCDSSSVQLATATSLSSQARPHKEEAARLWNQIAGRFNLPAVTGAQL